MILKQLRIWHVGPFGKDITVKFEPDITVLTGHNDTGKSTILNLIQTICTIQEIDEDNVNIDRRRESVKAWNEDADVCCIATFVLTNQGNFVGGLKNLQVGGELDISFPLVPSSEKPKIIGARHSDGANRSYGNSQLTGMPQILYMGLEEGIRSEIDFSNLNNQERILLKTVFGGNFKKKLESLSNLNRVDEVRRGSEWLSNRFSQILPESMPINFNLTLMPDPENIKLLISVRDRFGNDTPLHYRGSGVQKIFSLLASLLDEDLESGQIIVLFDEPETSLHADAQHSLRKFLELLSKNESIQVIYSTHSPSMINPARPLNIRLLERTIVKNNATIKVNNKPYSENFLPVRTSLGISPIDSLLYAATTIIVEGDSEVLSIPLLLRRLDEEKVFGFEDLDQIFPLIHFLNGGGDNFNRWCNIVESQGAKPIIFVDEDKIGRVRQQIDMEKVPVIYIQDGELEDLVPRETYFSALSTITQKDITMSDFEEWEAKAELPDRLLFSKRVNRWLQDNFNTDLDKPRTMEKAIELASLNDIRLDELKELVLVIKNLVIHELY